jgi:hypothetical protein
MYSRNVDPCLRFFIANCFSPVRNEIIDKSFTNRIVEMMFVDAGAAQTWATGILTAFLVIDRMHGDVKLAARLQFASVLEGCLEKARETDEALIGPVRVLKK